MKMFATERFTLTVSMILGREDDVPVSYEFFEAAWSRLVLQEGQESGIHVPATIIRARASRAHDDRVRVEPVAVVTGTRDPDHSPDAGLWRDAVLRLCRAARRRLTRATCRVDFDRDVEAACFEEED